jgi:hypothetical protein
MVLPAPIAIVVLKLAAFHIWPRYFFPLFGFAIVFLVHGVWEVCRLVARDRGPRVATIALVVAAAASIALLVPNWRLPKQDYEAARDFVAASRAPGEPVVTAGLASIPYAWLYAPDWTAVETAEDLDRLVGGSARTWLLYSFPKVLETSHPGILERARSRFELVREFPGTVGDGSIFVVRSR